MSKVNVLVLGVGGNVSQGIIKALMMSKLKYSIIGACIYPSSLGLYMCDKAYISPKANDPKFISWLIEICNKEHIQIVMTGVEEIVNTIAYHYEIIKTRTAAVSIFTNLEKLEIGQDKLATCEWLKENKCNYPRYCKSEDQEAVARLVEEVGYPLIAKPLKGKGSQGIIKITNKSELIEIKNIESYVIQECIGDENSEFTVGCYCDRYGNLINAIIMHRELKYGTTFRATVVENESIRKEVLNIVSKFKPIGPLNIQLRINACGKPVCFELNVRFSGTTPMRAHFGHNDVEAMIREYIFNEDIQGIFNVKKGTACRYFEEMYIDDEMQKKLLVDGVVENVNSYLNSANGFGGLK